MTHPYARELGEFLRARRNRLRPRDVGLEPGGRRKVTGLRREELALLAGLSTDYYQRMEQGREVRPSDGVSTRSPMRSSSTTRSAGTCSPWPTPPVGPCPAGWSAARSGFRTVRGGCWG
ncbi:helix-turn-helix domain-containing protein [Streptomyces ortus]|uniref:helix-turn-helix domain-containing protein n=1 Tax=Streptomyces ortus TaxID=2867268 RepID=UPI0027E39F13|nr:helix-turn-helix transcriptional regulator [Streptomyces ortus]